MSNQQALSRTVAALRSAGRLEDADEALVVAAESLAAAVDDDPGNAALWREYLKAEGLLRRTGEGAGDGELARLLDRLSSPMGDSSES